MVASFSPHRETGGTLHLPSPGGLHHDHTSSALNQLRRSLSRSPSKGSDFRPFSPSPLHSPSPKKTHFVSFSPSRRATQQGNKLFFVPAASGSPTAGSHSPSTPRFQRSAMRRNGRTNPSSPARHVLTESRDHGNAAVSPPSTPDQGDIHDRENMANERQVPPTETPDGEKGEGHEEAVSFSKPGPSRVEKRRSFCPVLTSSPLKRSDGIMNLDQVDQGSPSAKRRSLHGATSFPDFDIFDSQMGNTSLGDSGNADNESSASIFSRPPPSHFATVPKRSSSLRKSTLQQRQSDRSLFGRTKGNADSDSEPQSMTPLFSRTRPRMSLDSSLFQSPAPDAAPAPPPPPPTTTTTTTTLTNSSSPFLTARQNANSQSQQSTHPLSKAMTQSSSGSSFVDDSPTHEPIGPAPQIESSKPMFMFSKSLPAGTARPSDMGQLNKDPSVPNHDPNFATPESYKAAKPLPAAFMSTGLISKKNRNAAEAPSGSMVNKNMPDTPCKRTATLFPVHKKAGESKTKSGHTPSHSWTPLHPPPTTDTGTPFARGMGIFGSSFPRAPLSRRASFVSIEGDDQSQSPSGGPDSQSTIDSELPPTPTKRLSYSHNSHKTTSQSHRSQNSSFDFPSGAGGPNSKLSFVGSLSSNDSDDSDDFMDDSPSTNHYHKHSRHKLPSTTIPRSRPLQCYTSQYSHTKDSYPDYFSLTPLCRSSDAKLSTASPLNEKSVTNASPHTPQDHICPPDPSGLSISARNDRGPNLAEPHLSALPATPTGPREYFTELGKRHSLSLAGYSAPDVDPCLTSRFDKVELIGTGEFSQVYRVTEKQPTTTAFVSPFGSSTQTPSSGVPYDRVWAVKKTKQPYSGLKDRERRNNEVEVLKTLGTCDYVVSFLNSWEHHNHLYIQTEFCEEGSLDVFLSQVGLKARLDDFRIWKILLELSLGLQHIHDSGFIHLDLKPANILITFEGVLKIADFGMATRWPAAAGIEGEGDREYIGPEVLMGQFDKPADIFSLGLIVFETAGNVELPDNGVSWQKLRNGDISDVPSLTWSHETSTIQRDASGNPLPSGLSFDQLCGSDADEGLQPDRADNLSGMVRSGELEKAPSFMLDANDEHALDKLVRWMISPNASDRPKISDVVDSYGVQWAGRRRRAGATIYEGNWGPADEVLAEDAEMIDV